MMMDRLGLFGKLIDRVQHDIPSVYGAVSVSTGQLKQPNVSVTEPIEERVTARTLPPLVVESRELFSPACDVFRAVKWLLLLTKSGRKEGESPEPDERPSKRQRTDDEMYSVFRLSPDPDTRPTDVKRWLKSPSDSSCIDSTASFEDGEEIRNAGQLKRPTQPRDMSTVQPHCNYKDEAQDLCNRCNAVDFDKLLSMDGKTLSAGRVIQHMAYASASSNCPFCRFVAQMREAEDKEEGLSSLALVKESRQLGAEWKSELPCIILAGGDNPRKAGVVAAAIQPQENQDLQSQSIRIVQRKVDYNLIREWITQCDAGHAERCRQAKPAGVNGMRVIDCETRQIIPFSANIGEYVTLSYVWGSSDNTARPVGNVLADVPKVVEDAIVVVSELGFNYLWVDRYCIPQDGGREKHAQIRGMGKYTPTRPLP